MPPPADPTTRSKTAAREDNAPRHAKSVLGGVVGQRAIPLIPLSFGGDMAPPPRTDIGRRGDVAPTPRADIGGGGDVAPKPRADIGGGGNVAPESRINIGGGAGGELTGDVDNRTPGGELGRTDADETTAALEPDTVEAVAEWRRLRIVAPMLPVGPPPHAHCGSCCKLQTLMREGDVDELGVRQPLLPAAQNGVCCGDC